MEIGNFPKEGMALEGKIYWRLAVGKNAVPSRFFDGGWRAFEFVILKRFLAPTDQGAAVPYKLRIAFAYWFPFFLL